MVLKVNNVWSLCLKKKVIPNICARFPHDKITRLPTVLPELQRKKCLFKILENTFDDQCKY